MERMRKWKIGFSSGSHEQGIVEGVGKPGKAEWVKQEHKQTAVE